MQFFRKVIFNILPYGAVKALQKRQKKNLDKLPFNIKKILSANNKYKNIHENKRCFVVGTGPSIATQEIELLKSEYVFSMSSFYYHKDYDKIKPKYQVIAGICSHPDDASIENYPTDYYKDAEDNIISDDIFIDFRDSPIIQQNNLFLNKNINYYYTQKPIVGAIDTINLADNIYGFECISILTIQIAIYMGFKEIYLIGLDHDWILRFAERSNTHFYNDKQTSLAQKHNYSHWDASINHVFGNHIHSHHRMWSQYEAIQQYCLKNGICIYNSTNGGLLDVFPRKEFLEIFKL